MGEVWTALRNDPAVSVPRPERAALSFVIPPARIVFVSHGALHHVISMTESERAAMKPFSAFQDNPFLAQWMSTVNAMTSIWRGPWVDHLIEQQRAMITSFNEQTLNFWARGAATMAGVQGKAREATSSAMPSLIPQPVPSTAAAFTPSASTGAADAVQAGLEKEAAAMSKRLDLPRKPFSSDGPSPQR